MSTIASSLSHVSADGRRVRATTPVVAPRRSMTRPRGRVASRAQCPHEPTTGPTRLGDYRDGDGRCREVVALDGRAGSLLVVDRDAATLRDRRLVAHLAADEPASNSTLVCRIYLSHPDGRWCRRLCPGDLLAIPPSESPSSSDGGRCAFLGIEPIVARGYVHLLRPTESKRSLLELRWCRRRLGSTAGQWEPVGLRAVIAAVESYEPIRGMTVAAIARYRNDPEVALRRLRGEYRWLCTSSVVLNRALREAVLQAIDRDELSMSEIALRCGVHKRDRHGGCRGETSWLARRVGLMPEGGAKRITPWIHSDVLALIARKGLRVSPHEVEVP